MISRFDPLRVTTASATVHNLAKHLETLTGLLFHVVYDRYNGSSPTVELTVHHAVGREPDDEGWNSLLSFVNRLRLQVGRSSQMGLAEMMVTQAFHDAVEFRSATHDPVAGLSIHHKETETFTSFAY